MVQAAEKLIIPERSPLDSEWAQQNPREFAWLLHHVAGCKSFLEIGSSFGYSLRRFARFCPGAMVRSIDLGTMPKGCGKHAGTVTRHALLNRIDDCRTEGHDALVKFAGSSYETAVSWAQRWAPYDFVFIDGDHSYEGVRADWLNYGDMGLMTVFHDIALDGVGRLWREIKEAGYRTGEFCCSRWGIGIVYKQVF